MLGNFDGASDADSASEDGGPGAFGIWLRQAREAVGLSIPELATAASVSVPQIYNLESGRSLNPQGKTLGKLEKALKQRLPAEISEDVEEELQIEGLGALTDFDPHSADELPDCPGVYVFYDISDRPVYVGKAGKISTRVKSHSEKFWFKAPIVNHAAYVQIDDKTLRHQVEQVMIKFLKSNAVINKQSVERDDDEE